MRRLSIALALYALFAVAAFLLLTEERLYVVLLVLFLLALRTGIAHQAGWTISRSQPSHSETDGSERDPE